jgi:hypothetical protein
MRTDCLDADYISISGADARFFLASAFLFVSQGPNCLFFVNMWEGRGPGGRVSADFAPAIKNKGGFIAANFFCLIID